MGCVPHSMTKQINGPHTVHVATYKSCALTASGFATISGFSAENVRDFHMASRQLLAPSVTSGGRSASAVAAGGAFGAPAEAIVVSRLLVTSLLHSRTQRAREAFTGKCNLRYGDRCGYAAAEWCGGSASKLCVCACVALVGLAQIRFFTSSQINTSQSGDTIRRTRQFSGANRCVHLFAAKCKLLTFG